MQAAASRCLRQRLTRSCRARFALRARRVEPTLQPTRQFSSSERFLDAQDARRVPLDAHAAGRLQTLASRGFTEYPRPDEITTETCFSWSDLTRAAEELKPGNTSHDRVFAVSGRIHSVRLSGNKLMFMDLADQHGSGFLQVVLKNNHLAKAEKDSEDKNLVKPFSRFVARGDFVSATGYAHRTPTGQISLLAKEIPRLQSPCIHTIPTTEIGDDSDLAHDRCVQMLADSSRVHIVVLRHYITAAIDKFLNQQHFIKVQTPILAASAGGATARPFETSASEFSDRKLALRIAPELWLKKMLIGGLHRVYEIGPSFRNEGLDKTHNPEFTTCEFYAVQWGLKTLQTNTVDMIGTLITQLSQSLSPSFVERVPVRGPYPEIDFIPALTSALGLELPDLSTPTAREAVLEIFEQRDLPLPSVPTLPRLLDKLSSIVLEPQCDKATWIINTPECLSPLAKSFWHPDLPYQRVAARAELFIQHREVVNCYEEENSPFEQRRKFVDQQKHARLPSSESNMGKDEVDHEVTPVDEDYLRALEWGLPPTGGWGCGIDRLVMLMLGKDKISDVLPFGNLRMVTRGAEKWEKQAQEHKS